MFDTLRTVCAAICGTCLAAGIAAQTIATAAGPAAPTQSSLSSMTPRSSDIPRSLGTFRQQLNEPLSAAQLVKTNGLRGNAASHGFRSGLATVFVRTTRASSGAFIVTVGIASFSSSSGAHWLMGLERKGKIEDSIPHAVSVGDEGLSFVVGRNGGRSEIVFRQGAYVGEVGVQSFGKPPMSAVRQLAATLDARLTHA